MQNQSQKYIVREVIEEAPGVKTLSLTLKDGSVPPYTIGQHINVVLKKSSTPEGKAYSISSAPHEPTLKITVKNMGEFSDRLCKMNPDNTLFASTPYGFFRPENESASLVMIAAGIGITPFRGMTYDVMKKDPSRKIDLFHSVRTSEDAVFRDEFLSMQDKNSNFSITHFITREKKPSLPKAVRGRIQISNIFERLQNDAKTEFLVCGSIQFTRDMWKELKSHDISEDYIYTEDFFSV